MGLILFWSDPKKKQKRSAGRLRPPLEDLVCWRSSKPLPQQAVLVGFSLKMLRISENAALTLFNKRNVVLFLFGGTFFVPL